MAAPAPLQPSLAATDPAIERVGARSTPRRSVNAAYQLAAWLFLAAMLVQNCILVVLNSYEATSIGLDLLAMVPILGFGAVLILRLVVGRKLGPLALVAPAIYLSYIAIIITITAPTLSASGFLLTRQGMILWFLIGIASAGMMDVFQDAAEAGKGRLLRLGVWLLLLCLAGFTGAYAAAYMAFPVETLSYQDVANAGMIILILVGMTLGTLWRGQLPIVLLLLFLAISVTLSSAIAMTQSTAIVGFLMAFLVVFFLDSFRRLRHWELALVGAVVVVAIVVLLATVDLAEATKGTRFSTFFDGSGESFSSISSRLKLLAHFFEQFDVSPFFGHFQAEVQAGSGTGNFVHSLPLSSLTHTGIAGFALLLLTIYAVLQPRLFRTGLDPAERQLGNIFLALLALGTLFAFMSWIVFWFGLGLLCRRPRRQFQGIQE